MPWEAAASCLAYPQNLIEHPAQNLAPLIRALVDKLVAHEQHSAPTVGDGCSKNSAGPVESSELLRDPLEWPAWPGELGLMAAMLS